MSTYLCGILISLSSSLAMAAREQRVPVQVSPELYVAPDMTEIRGYFFTLVIAILAFFAKEIWVWMKQRNNTTFADLIELKRNDMIILNKLEVISEQLKYKPDKNEVTREIIDRVQKEIEHVTKVR